tara:strand:- start:811 stop:1038 length:228 start_codon:yes stop_codon:yes gene_type:complete
VSYALDSSVRFAAMRDALNRTGRSMLYSTEPFSMHPEQSAQRAERARRHRRGVVDVPLAHLELQSHDLSASFFNS